MSPLQVCVLNEDFASVRRGSNRNILGNSHRVVITVVITAQQPSPRYDMTSTHHLLYYRLSNLDTNSSVISFPGRCTSGPELISGHYRRNCCRGIATAQQVLSHIYSYNWHNHVRSSSKHALNSSVFICRLNAIHTRLFLLLTVLHSEP